MLQVWGSAAFHEYNGKQYCNIFNFFHYTLQYSTLLCINYPQLINISVAYYNVLILLVKRKFVYLYTYI